MKKIRLTYKNGKYVGEVNNLYEPHGQGTYTWKKSGAKYVGKWKYGKKHGRGTETWKSGKFAGDKYVGEFKNNLKNGQGTYTWGKGKFAGDKYVGEYKNGYEHGQGTLTWASGGKFVGKWKDGKKHDGIESATFTKDGYNYKGHFKNGKSVKKKNRLGLDDEKKGKKNKQI